MKSIAMFNNKGRGFVGFRKIVTEDFDSEAQASRRLRKAEIYHQKFPLVSELECAVTQLVSDSLTELNCATTQAISITKRTQFEFLNSIAWI